MDRRVKERLIGASILVALIVLVVPELLSGPKVPAPPPARLPVAGPDSHRVIEIEVASAKPAGDTSDANLSTTPAASAAEPPPAAPAAPVRASASPSTPAAVAPASTSAPVPARAAPTQVETSTPSPISSARAWAVQLGSFERRDNAEKLQRQLKIEGFQVYTLAGGTGSALRYRVRVGPLADRESAERTAVKLKSLGHVSSIVPPAA
jgi:DedD protein